MVTNYLYVFFQQATLIPYPQDRRSDACKTMVYNRPTLAPMRPAPSWQGPLRYRGFPECLHETHSDAQQTTALPIGAARLHGFTSLIYNWDGVCPTTTVGSLPKYA